MEKFKVLISWADPANVAYLDHLEVWRKEEAGGTFAKIGADLVTGTESMEDDNGGTGLTLGATYFYQVRTYGPTGSYAEVESSIEIVEESSGLLFNQASNDELHAQNTGYGAISAESSWYLEFELSIGSTSESGVLGVPISYGATASGQQGDWMFRVAGSYGDTVDMLDFVLVDPSDELFIVEAPGSFPQNVWKTVRIECELGATMEIFVDGVSKHSITAPTTMVTAPAASRFNISQLVSGAMYGQDISVKMVDINGDKLIFDKTKSPVVESESGAILNLSSDNNNDYILNTMWIPVT